MYAGAAASKRLEAAAAQKGRTIHRIGLAPTEVMTQPDGLGEGEAAFHDAGRTRLRFFDTLDPAACVGAAADDGPEV